MEKGGGEGGVERVVRGGWVERVVRAGAVVCVVAHHMAARRTKRSPPDRTSRCSCGSLLKAAKSLISSCLSAQSRAGHGVVGRSGASRGYRGEVAEAAEVA